MRSFGGGHGPAGHRMRTPGCTRRQAIGRCATVVLAAGVLDAACGPRTARPIKAIANPVVLVWRPWQNFPSGTNLRTAFGLMYEATAPFRAQHKGLEIKLSAVSPQGGTVTSLLAGEGPDVFEDWVLNMFTDQGLALDLAPMIQRDSVNLSVLPAGMVDYIRANGRNSPSRHGFFAMPDYLNTKAMAVNLGALSTLGIAAPQPEWTYADWADMWKKSSSRGKHRTGGGIYWYNGHGNNTGPGPWYLHAFGGGYVDPQNTARAGLTSSGSLQFFDFLMPLISSGAVAPWANGSFRAGQQISEAIGTAGSLMSAAENWDSLRWDLFPMPTGPKGRFTAGYLGFYAIDAQTKQPDLAWEFVKWLCLGETWQKFMIHLNLHGPILVQLWSEWQAMVQAAAPPLRSKSVDVIVQQVQNNQAWTGLPFKYADDACGKIISAYISAMLAQRLSVQEAMQQCTQQITAYEQQAANEVTAPKGKAG